MPENGWDSAGWEARTKQFYDKHYADHKYAHGSAMFGCPVAQVAAAKMGIVGLNPGMLPAGDRPRQDGNEWSYPTTAFFDEKWGAPDPARGGRDQTALKRQVAAWVRLAGVEPTETFSAQFVPFRSANWTSLPDREEALAFARNMWTDLLRHTVTKIFVCMGQTAALEIARLLDARDATGPLPTGWGETKIRGYANAEGSRLVSVPHPSRYLLFGRSGERSRRAEESFRAAALGI